jgi:hypothetical protein
MSSTISTRDALSSNRKKASGRCWRVVEAQNQISTTKLTDTRAEQHALELLIEETKPPVPAECRHLNFLLSTPFRYGAAYPRGSRFRRAGFTPGVFYASERVETAIAELCFLRLLFFSESPDTKWPANAGEYTAFAAKYATKKSLDLTSPPFDSRSAVWMHPTDYEPCQTLAEMAREADVELIRYASVRDPEHHANLAILSCRAFAHSEPVAHQTWQLLFGSNGARAVCELPRRRLDFQQDGLSGRPAYRIDAMGAVGGRSMRISAPQFRSRHCERSEAIQAFLPPLDCFVALLLAMTMAIGAGSPAFAGTSSLPNRCNAIATIAPR